MSDFFNFYGRHQIDFSVLPATQLIGGLCFQIIPIVQHREDLSHSIVIDEVAFSVVEDIFLERKPYAHWGQTIIGLEKAEFLIHRLVSLYKDLDDLNYESLNEICTNEIKRNKHLYHPMIRKMIQELIVSLNSYRQSGYESICILGV